jgi:hypothetical protein
VIRGASAGLLLLAGCATAGPGPGWSYRTNYGVGDPDRPIAVYGWPETLASFALECDVDRRALLLVGLDVTPFTGSRPITVAARRAIWTGSEIADPPDLIATSQTLIPLDHLVVDAVAAGAPIRLRTGEGTSVLKSGPAPVRVARECRALVATRER